MGAALCADVATIHAAAHLGVPHLHCEKACQVMGRTDAAITLPIVSTKPERPERYFRRSAGACKFLGPRV
jgi:hypothetical protein